MAASPVVLILGAGPRVGASVADKFASNGYKVAVASRSGSGTKNNKGFLSLKADFANPDSIPALFAAVKAEFHAGPNVVIYNAAATTNPPNKESIFSISADSIISDLNVNIVTPYVAAQEAVNAWEILPKGAKKTFIYTGNIQNVSVLPVPLLMSLGIGKAGSAYWVGAADATGAAQGYRFFYADERYEDGLNKGLALDGAAHAEFYSQLANQEGNVPWHATFVKNKGYVHFN